MKKKLAYLLSAALISTGLSIPAEGKGSADTVYKYIDLSAYANCIGFAAELYADKKYTAPDYIGSYTNAKNEKDMKSTWILNKTAFDEKCDSEGLIYAEDGTPFEASTAADAKNIILLSKKASSGDEISGLAADGSVTLENLDGQYRSVSILADITGKQTCKVVITYSDASEDNPKTESVKFITHNTEAKLSENTDVDSFVKFEYIAPTEDDEDAGRKSAMLLKDTGVVAETQNMPVYTLALDEKRELESIKITCASNSFGLAILAVTLEEADQSELLGTRIDALPESVDFGNYKTYRAEIIEIKAKLDAGVEVSAEKAAKVEALYALVTKFDNDPAEEIKYLIDKLPSADEITAANYKSFSELLEEISEKITSDISIDEERMTKYNAVLAAIKTEGDKAELSELIAELPNVSDINEMNYENLADTLEKIAKMLEAGIKADDAATEKYNAVLAAVEKVRTSYNPWVMVDYKKSYNAKLYGTSDMTINDETVRTPYYLGKKENDTSIMYYPTRILNKKLFEKMAANGVIYSENKNIPFAVDTTGGVMLGSNGGPNGEAAEYRKEVPITQGNYESVSILLISTYEIDPDQFQFTVNYTDGTSVTDPDWKLPDIASTVSGLLANDCADDAVFFKLDTSSTANQLSSSAFFERKGTAYYNVPRSVDGAIPVVTLECDPQKTVKSIYLTETDTWRAMALLGVTAKLPAQEQLKDIIEEKIKAIDTKNLAAESDNIYAIVNMLGAYEGKSGSESIANLSDFESIKKTFESSIVEVSSIDTKTDLDKTAVSIKFKNAIDVSDVKALITMTLNGTAFSDYSVDIVSNSELKITIANDLDYDKSFKLTLSSKIQSQTDASFKLGSDYTYEFEPKAPVSIEKFEVYDSLSGLAGSTVRFEIDVKNNSISPSKRCAVSVCVHDKDNKLVKVYVWQKTLLKGESIKDKKSFTLPSDGEYKMTCYVLDGFETLEKLTRNIVK